MPARKETMTAQIIYSSFNMKTISIFLICIGTLADNTTISNHHHIMVDGRTHAFFNDLYVMTNNSLTKHYELFLISNFKNIANIKSFRINKIH